MLASPTIGAAQSDAEEEEARTLFQAGELAYSQGRFERALDYFQRAYELSARAGLLFNIANLQERLNHRREALATFERYVEAAPDAESIAFAQARIETSRISGRRARPTPRSFGWPGRVHRQATAGRGSTATASRWPSPI